MTRADRLLALAKQIVQLEGELALKRAEFARMARKTEPLPRHRLKEIEEGGFRVLVHDSKEGS